MALKWQAWKVWPFFILRRKLAEKLNEPAILKSAKMSLHIKKKSNDKKSGGVALPPVSLLILTILLFTESLQHTNLQYDLHQKYP